MQNLQKQYERFKKKYYAHYIVLTVNEDRAIILTSVVRNSFNSFCRSWTRITSRL